MDKDDTFELLFKGRKAWNTWAEERLREKEKLQAKGDSTAYWKTEAAADFSGISNRKLDCSQFMFPADAKFAGARIEGGSNFSGATFMGRTDFTSATFQEGASFRNCKFHGDIAFKGAEFFNQPSDFSGSEVTGDANFERTRFEAHADFQQAKFGGSVEFNQAKFLQRVSFDNARFRDDAAFTSAEFSASASWFDARFNRAAYFADTTFLGPVRFDAAKFKGAAGFTQAKFLDNASFRKAKFSSPVDFVGATFQKAFHQLANFENVEFIQDVDFERARFGGLAKFRGSHFHRAANFKAISAESSFDMAGAQFHNNVPNLVQAHFPEAPRLDHMRVPTVPELRRASLPVGTYATARYRALKRLAIQGHDHDRELQFFADELRSQQGGWTVRSWFISLYGWFSDFGRSISRPAFWWVGATVLFAAAYFVRHLMIGHSGCVAGNGNPIPSAIYVALRKAFVLPGFGSDQKLSLAYACLYGKTSISEDGRPLALVPDSIAFFGIAQTLTSAVLIFLFLLAVRNHFRIK